MEAKRDEISYRNHVEQKLERRPKALFQSLVEWLPRAIAWDRAMNAAAPIFMLETVKRGFVDPSLLEPRRSIEASLRNRAAMRGFVVTPERLDAAVRAWESATHA